MELKDVVLSTLAEMEDNDAVKQDLKEAVSENVKPQIQTDSSSQIKTKEETLVKPKSLDDELQFLNSIRERLLVLFEGFQAPNNTQIEAKVDITLNFLEYTLATIDDRLEKIEKGNK